MACQIERERDALRLSPDEWMIPLFDDAEAGGKRDVLEGRLVWLAFRALQLGVDVVLDFGLWRRDERSALLSMATDMGARCELLYLPVSLDEQLRRLRERSLGGQPGAVDLDEAQLRDAAQRFQAPDRDECEGTNVPPPPAPWRSWAEWAVDRWPTVSG